mmetsp:Transcript_12899/g.25364  ORF Transcript_12899/g.25364 Transcript_12899/m.25364 type:complete len:442 (+) Transcript_12899:51-1376(+)
MSAEEVEGSFFAILTQLGNVHKHEVEAVTKGLERTSSEALPTIHELVKELVTQHEREIQAVRVQLPVSLQKLNNEWVVDATTEPLWHIGDPCLPKKGGPEQQELEQLAEARREKNDMSNKAAASIKDEIQEQEVKMLKILNELKSSSWGPIEIDIRKRVCGHVRAMENGDVQLACLRKEQLLNIEQIRVAKVDIWRLQCHADSNDAISEVEIALRSGDNKMEKLEPTERRLRSHEETMEDDVTKAMQKVQDIISQRAQLEAKCGKAQDDVWKVTYEEHDALIQLWKNTFEMLALSWKQSHVREKQLCIMEDRWKLLHVQTMLRRQEDAEKAAKAGDRAAMESICARLEDLTVGFQNEAVSTKAKIADLLEKATEAQTQLRGFKHVQTVESDKVRDNFLLLSFIVMVEDVRLAWLRKEQLQAVDLTGLLRRALAESEDLDGM